MRGNLHRLEFPQFVWRLAAVVGIVAITITCVALTLAIPPEGVVSGICRDSVTGLPLDDVTVTLSSRSPWSSSQFFEKPNQAESNTEDDENNSSTGPNWSQGSDNDSTVDLAGESTDEDSSYDAQTDDHGRFVLSHVPAGQYHLDASSSSHAMDQRLVVVAEGEKRSVSLNLTRSKSTLSFLPNTQDWAFGETPRFELSGSLQTTQIQIEVDRADVDPILPKRPYDDIAPMLSRSKPHASGLTYTPVYKWNYVVRDADDDGSFDDHFKIPGLRGPLPEGMYRVTAFAVDHGSLVQDTAWRLVTRLAVIGKSYNGRVLAYVTDIVHGKPVAGATVRLFNDSGDAADPLLSTANTGNTGLANLSSAGAQEESNGILLVKSGASIIGISMDLNSPGTNEASSGLPRPTLGAGQSGRTLRSYIYTDRPVYRPGQTVFVKGVCRWYRAPEGFGVPANAPVEVDLRDAQDTVISHLKLSTNRFGSWNTRVLLSEDAVTGQYTIRETLGGQVNRANFDVAAYRKPEYQATVSFSKDRYIHGDVIRATIAAAYFFGAPVTGLADIVVYRGDDAISQNGPGEAANSDDESGEPILKTKVTLDQLGQAQIDIPTQNQPNSDQAQSYSVNADITDSSGADIYADGSTTVAQGDYSLDVSPSANICHVGDPVSILARAVDGRGNPVLGRQVEFDSKYDIYTSDGQERIISLNSAHANTVVPDGAASTTVLTTRPGMLDVDLSSSDSRGNTITANTQIWVTGIDEDIPTQYPGLEVVLDKDQYSASDTAHLLINTAHPGPDALITIEGATIYKTMVVPLVHHSTSVAVYVDPIYAPSVTVAATMVIDSQCLSGSAQLVVKESRLPLRVAIKTDKTTYRPGDVANMRLSTTDSSGKPVRAEVSLGVVDSAIYAIEPGSTQTIVDAFEPDQGNTVQTQDSCENPYYGDVDKGASDIHIRRKFPDTAAWAPDIDTGSSGSAVFKLQVPDSLTSWRITCIGHTADTHVGQSTATFAVSKPFLVRLETPAFLVQGDKSTLVGLVHNNTSRLVTANIGLSASGLQVEAAAPISVSIEPNKPQQFTWPVSANTTGTATIDMTGSTAKLNDGVEEAIPVEVHGVLQHTWNAGSLLSSATTTVWFDPKAIRSSSSLEIRLAPTISSALAPAVDYLASYPYGGTDSTTSTLIADAVLIGASVPGNEAIGLNSAQRAQLSDMARRSLLRLMKLQQRDGAWGWFSTSTEDLWMTAYAAWGLETAQRAGLKVDRDDLDGAMESTKSLALQERTTPHAGQIDTGALALATPALAEYGLKAAAANNCRFLERLWSKYPTWADNEQVAQVALAEATLGDKAEAAQLMNRLWRVSRSTGAACSWTADYHRSAAGAAQELPDQDETAWVFLAALEVSPADPRLDAVAYWLMTNRTGDHWVCPTTTATTMLGLSIYRQRSHELQPNFDAQVLVNGVPQISARFGADSVALPDFHATIQGTHLKPGLNSIEIQKTGPGRLYYSLEAKVAVLVPKPAAPLPLLGYVWYKITHPYPAVLGPSPSGFRIKRVYMRLTTRRNFFWEDTVPAPDTAFQVGDSILVRLIIDGTRAASRIAVESPIPAGCRISDVSGDEEDDWSNWWDYTDVRDDRIVFFISDMTTGEHEIDYHLQAATPGSYDSLPVTLASTVDPSVTAVGKADRTTVSGAVQ